MSHEFLSEDWFAAVEALPVPAPAPGAPDIQINVVVTRDGGDDVQIHMGGGTLQRGLNESAPTTITVPYDVAKSLFVNRDQAATMQAFMSGKIKVAGDMTKLMMMGQQQPTPEQEAYANKIQELTVA